MIKVELSEKEKQGLNEEEQELAIARKLEVEMLPLLRRNINFFYAGANIPKKAQAYNQPMNQEKLEKTISEKSKAISVVCKPLCEMVVSILRENGLNAQTLSCDTDMFRHTDVLLTTKSGKQYIINYLEDMENVQTGMKTPDFASKAYYERRYKKFEGGLTTDGKSLSNISFLDEDTMGKIDENLGYKKFGMYMDDVIEQIKVEFENFREVMTENTYAQAISDREKAGQILTDEEKRRIHEEIAQRYNEMSDDQILEQKLDWIFNYFNERMDITGHTDFVMYYSRLVLAKVLSPEEYKKLTRYDCFAKASEVPENSKLKDILDYDNIEASNKLRFCVLECGDKAYAFSTKPNSYVKLPTSYLEEVRNYANLAKSEKPSDLLLRLCDRGNALPLVFHPLGSKMLNERAAMLNPNLSPEERRIQTQKLADSIKGTDGEVTSLTIPYPDGSQRYIYINPDNEFTVKDKNGTVIYHYYEDKDVFEKEFIDDKRGDGRED